MLHITLDEYQKFSAEDYNWIPLWTEIIGDCLTPVSIYQKVRKIYPYSFLLESVQQNEKLGRFSFIGINALIKFESLGDDIKITKDGKVEELKGNPLDELSNLMNSLSLPEIKELKNYISGVVGYFSYDTVRHIEKLPDSNTNRLDVPESLFILPETVIIFDHIYQSIKLVTLAKSGNDKNFLEGENRVKQVSLALQKAGDNSILRPISNAPETEPVFSSNMEKSEYMAAVEKAKEYIYEGDIFQVVLSQRFQMEYSSDSFEVYRSLRRINPSPYLFFLEYSDFQIAGSSPEILIKKEGTELTLRPIAGTRKRGATEEEDQFLTEELLNDPKEVSEHMMLVDLGRNDLGKISKFGTVKSHGLKQIENYSNVKHIVTNLKSEIAEGVTMKEVISSGFPAGTLSGAPKVRAMEIIDELETTKRGFYGGTVANINLAGNIDACIGIRSVILKDGTAYIQAGAGVVADSIPENEYEECVNKAKALMRAIQLTNEEQA